MDRPLIGVRYRVDARPFPSEIEARVAIMEDKPENLEDCYSIRKYTGDGWYVLATRPNGDCRWIARGTK